MEQGTRAALVRDGIPTGDRTTLMMKDSWNEEDDVFKRRAATDIRARGRVVAAFDNEPANIAVFVEQFPDAMNVWVRTIDSGRPARPVRGVYTMGGGANDRADWPSDHRG
jgi:predicted NBD/HSP70 family sugar kinase